jgi:mono/diheme cytochrome c family protein
MKKFSAIAFIWLFISCQNEEMNSYDKLAYHYDRERPGWHPNETRLTPESVSGPLFTQLWQTPQLDSVGGDEPRLFASPLYVDRLTLSGGQYEGKTLSVVFAATDVGYLYAVNASAEGDIAPGTILWKRRISEKKPSRFGNIGTPVIDLERQRIYMVGNSGRNPEHLHALDLGSGEPLENWPVPLDSATINAPTVKRNDDSTYFPSKNLIQRGALNLNSDGSRIYVPFAGNWGWLISIDTEAAKVASAFSVTTEAEENGGLWASAGISIDSDDNIHTATGSNVVVTLRKLGIPGVFPDSENNWGQSIIRLRDDPEKGLELVGTYSPFNWALTQSNDIDLASSGTVVIDLDPATTSTPHLLVAGGKQGNVYLLDRENMPGSLVKRPSPSDDPGTDGSLLSPEPHPQFGKPAPLNVFGPYMEDNAMNDQARSRTTAAYFKSETGKNYVFVTGTTKTGENWDISVPPNLARLEIVSEPGKPAYLRIDQLELSHTLQNPGSPIVTSNGGRDAIVWILDTNTRRTSPVRGEYAGRPVLYAFDALTFKLLWKSSPDELGPGGKYNEPAIAKGVVYVGTDRIQAFGLLPSADTPRPVFESPFANMQVSEKIATDQRILDLGKTLVEKRCVACHVNGAQPGAPSFDVVGKLEKSRIVDALTTGTMAPQAAGLNRTEILAIADYLKSRLTSSDDRAAGE